MGVGGVKNVSIYSAVHKISRTFEMLTPDTPRPRVSWRFKKSRFSGQFMHISRTFYLCTPKNPPGSLLVWGGSIILDLNYSQINPHICVAKFGRGPTVVSKKGDTDDRHTGHWNHCRRFTNLRVIPLVGLPANAKHRRTWKSGTYEMF